MSLQMEITELQIKVTDAALTHFQRLIENEDTPGMNVRIYVANPGTSHADIGVTFCPIGEEEEGDIPISLNNFTLFVDSLSKEALLSATIDYEDDELGGQLSIKAPHLKGKKPEQGSPLLERVEYVLNSEINPGLAGHGGRVSLVEILNSEDAFSRDNSSQDSHHSQDTEGEKNKIVVLRFGGGCHGCGMVNVTLKGGIEKTLKEKFPEISEVRDVTDHTAGQNPYYA